MWLRFGLWWGFIYMACRLGMDLDKMYEQVQVLDWRLGWLSLDNVAMTDESSWRKIIPAELGHQDSGS